jgi:hypothetical protein
MFGTASIIPGKIWNVDLRQGLDGVGSTLLWDLARHQDLLTDPVDFVKVPRTYRERNQ